MMYEKIISFVDCFHYSIVDIIGGSEMGLAPLETGLMIDASYHFSDSSITCLETGVEIVASNNPEEYLAQINGEGLYLFTVQVADNYNIICTDSRHRFCNARDRDDHSR